MDGDEKYTVFTETDEGQGFSNNGIWERTIPVYSYHEDKDIANAPGLYWWQKRYIDYVDAKIVKKFTTPEAYSLWRTKYIDENPELFV